ncbi:uncharacterized protein LOC143198943 [Rhynchophorus ferrugineus]|uniref:uncharacterized protein LOC143198943 n=1 Tax=Rhynchophorus ferrugineus TaxID=354439 RepID=UPI003FCC6060
MWSKHNGNPRSTNMTFKNKITNKKQKNLAVGSIEQSDSISTENKANDADKKKHTNQQQAKQTANRTKNKGRHRNKKASAKDQEKSIRCDVDELKNNKTEEDAATPTDEHDGVVLRNNNGVRASDVVVKRYSDSFVIENGVTESDPVVEGKSSTPTPLTRALSGFFVLDQTKKANRRLSDLFRPVSAKLSGSTESLKMSTKAEKHCISDKKDKKDSKQIDQSAKGRSNQKNDSAKKISQTKPHEADKPSGTDNTTNSYLKRVKSKIYKSKSDDASKIEVDGKYKKLKPKKSLDLNSRIPEEDVPSTPSPES